MKTSIENSLVACRKSRKHVSVHQHHSAEISFLQFYNNFVKRINLLLRDFTCFLICKFCAAKVFHSWSVQAYKLRSEAGLPHRFVWCQGAREIEFLQFYKMEENILGVFLNVVP